MSDKLFGYYPEMKLLRKVESTSGRKYDRMTAQDIGDSRDQEGRDLAGGGGWVGGGSQKWQSERQNNRRALIFKAHVTAADWLTVSGRENDWAGV